LILNRRAERPAVFYWEPIFGQPRSASVQGEWLIKAAMAGTPGIKAHQTTRQILNG
jgi:hypothetical protein